VARGFKGMVPVIGRWTDKDVLVVHLEPEEYFAKLLLPLPRMEGSYRLGFTARSTGRAWVGFGLHFAASPVLTHKGYGEGRSYLVWLTSDPVHREDGGTRLQLYRSERDTYLDLVSDVAIPDSLFGDSRVLVTVIPAGGRLVVEVNGVERLNLSGLNDLGAGDYVVFRSLDMSEFSSFEAEQQE
jgi:hypothetical protein